MSTTENDMLQFYTTLFAKLCNPASPPPVIPAQNPKPILPGNISELTTDAFTKQNPTDFANVDDYQPQSPDAFAKDKQYILGNDKTGFFSFREINTSQPGEITFTQIFNEKPTKMKYANRVITTGDGTTEMFVRPSTEDTTAFGISTAHVNQSGKIVMATKLKTDEIKAIHAIYVKLAGLLDKLLTNAK